MFFYVTNAKFTHDVICQTLDSIAEPMHSEYVEQIVEWLEAEWGYLRNLGKDWRRTDVLREQSNFFVVTYAKQPIGLFVLNDVENFKAMRVKELWCFYIDQSFRGFGFAPKMMDMVKEICRMQGANMMVLDTFNPKLNKFYEKRGAKVVCDGSFTVTDLGSRKITYPTTLLSMSFLPPPKEPRLEGHRMEGGASGCSSLRS